MKKNYNFEIYAIYYFKPYCPYCGLGFNKQYFDTMKELEKTAFEYLHSDDYVCMGCMDVLEEAKKKEKQ